MKLVVPQAVRLGDTITLTCDYDLESQALYSVKWYKNDLEFYRYIPKESPPSRVFVMESINVDISRSNSRKVTLRNVEKGTTGTFQCEVSSDAPSFQTEMLQAELTVAEVPTEEPVLRSDIHNNKITPGVRFNANCTTPGSYPSMNVTWYINNEKVSKRPDVQTQSSVVYYDALPGLETVRSSITVDTSSILFKHGRINLKCIANLFDLYNDTKEIDIFEDTPQLAPIREHHTEKGYPTNKGHSIIRQNIFLIAFSFLSSNYLRNHCNNDMKL